MADNTDRIKEHQELNLAMAKVMKICLKYNLRVVHKDLISKLNYISRVIDRGEK